MNVGASRVENNNLVLPTIIFLDEVLDRIPESFFAVFNVCMVDHDAIYIRSIFVVKDPLNRGKLIIFSRRGNSAWAYVPA